MQNATTLLKPIEALTHEDYQMIFEAERRNEYLILDDMERKVGIKLSRSWLERAAFVLACPYKRNAPNWQHGRLLYTLASAYLENKVDNVLFLDVGTAKGFSALCLNVARIDSGKSGRVVSLDVIDPNERRYRNSVAEVDGKKTLHEILELWKEEADGIEFKAEPSLAWLQGTSERVHIAFLDGKHNYTIVSAELSYLARRQAPGDIVVLDDAHIDGIMMAIRESHAAYKHTTIKLKEGRWYSVGVRR